MLQLLPASIIGRVVVGGLAAGALGLGVAALWRRLRGGNEPAAEGARQLAPPGHVPGTVRVMTFNIKAAHGAELLGDATPAERERNLRAIAAYIERVDPDVVLLQEVEQGFDRGGSYPMFDRLRALLHADDAAMSDPKVGAAIMTRNGYAIADRADGGNHVHSGKVDRSSVMTAEITGPGGAAPFTVVNGHVSPATLPGLAERVGDVRDGSLDPAAPFPRRVIVGGDFNTQTTNVSRALAREGRFSDVLSRLGIGPSDALRRMTSPTPFGNTPWTVADRDQIHLSEGFGPVTGAVIMDPRYASGPLAGTPLSDHRPMIADIRLTPSDAD